MVSTLPWPAHPQSTSLPPGERPRLPDSHAMDPRPNVGFRCLETADGTNEWDRTWPPNASAELRRVKMAIPPWGPSAWGTEGCSQGRQGAVQWTVEASVRRAYWDDGNGRESCRSGAATGHRDWTSDGRSAARSDDSGGGMSAAIGPAGDGGSRGGVPGRSLPVAIRQVRVAVATQACEDASPRTPPNQRLPPMCQRQCPPAPTRRRLAVSDRLTPRGGLWSLVRKPEAQVYELDGDDFGQGQGRGAKRARNEALERLLSIAV